MIAAAAAAMIGGAKADGALYDFEADFHTTVGEPGEDIFVRDEAKLGRNDSGMWYMDAALVAECTDGSVNRTWKDAATEAKYPNLVWTTGKSYNGVVYPKFAIRTQDLSAEYGEVNKSVPMLATADEIALIKRLAATYNQQSYGFWCGEYEWWTKTDKVCYRVWGPDTIESEIAFDDSCCGDDTHFFVNKNGPCIVFNTNTVAGAVFNRFAAQTYDDAIAYEIFAQVTNLTMKTSGLAFNGFLAGQGYRYDGDTYPAELHGSIVGYTDAPSCPDCCVDPLPKAVAFECNWSTTPDASLRTAAYGTFRIVRK